MNDDETRTSVPEKSLNPFECAKFDVTDDFLSKGIIRAYMCNNMEKDSRGEKKPYNPKTFPERAVDLTVDKDGFKVEIFLDTNVMAWDSRFKLDGRVCKLSFEQFDQFFKSAFYKKLLDKLSETWPISDPMYSRLFDGLVQKRMKVGFSEEDLKDWELTENDMPNKRTDLANRDLTGDGVRDYTATGRKILTFGDNGVKGHSGKYYCWPNPKYPFKWSQWKDWSKIKPLCKMNFVYNGRPYMVSLSPFDENFDNRGFRACDTKWEPPLGWVTPGECEQIMKLSIVRKFTRECVRKLKPYLDMTAEEVYERINNKKKITLDEIRKTMSVIKHVVNSALRTNKADTYCWK